MTEADLPTVTQIERCAYEFPWSEGVFRDCIRTGHCCWLFESQGVIEAYGIMSVVLREAHLLNLCVRPRCQRRGLGRHMLMYLLSLAGRHRAETVLLEVRPSNRIALGLYQSLGFNEVGLRRAYYPAASGREDAVILARSLAAA
jgi:ribosomal-protein-alanine N-acetyltransferase